VKTGRFIVLEGLDACGKDTVGDWLADQLDATVFRFPDRGTPFGKIIQAHLDRKWYARNAEDVGRDHLVDAAVFQACQLANRLEVATRLRQTLLSGRDAVAVRYGQSGVAYGTADGLDFDHMITTYGALPQPDVSILLDVDFETSCARRPDRRDRYEAAGRAFYDRVRWQYHRLWSEAVPRSLPGHWLAVDARRPLSEVQSEVLAAARAT
jgi:dTMP kinase